jgi:hypothetical protein
VEPTYVDSEVNLLEGAGVPMCLVVVSADLGNDSGHSDENANVHLPGTSNRR